jgi:hypothetical protein
MSFWSAARRVVDEVECWWKTGEVCPRETAGPNPNVWFPEDVAPGADQTYHGPDITAKTLDQYRTLVQNPVTVGIAVLQLALENRSRKELIIVNTGTTAIYIGFGFNPTPTNYTMFLQPCSVANDGTGGTIISDAWKGAVFCISSAAGGVLNFAEIPA